MKKFSKDDYQYWLNADFYRLVMEDSRFDKEIIDDAFWNDFTKKCIVFSEKYRHFGGRYSVKWALAVVECRKAMAEENKKPLQKNICKQMLAEFYIIQERFNEIYNCDEFWARFTKTMVDFGEKYSKYTEKLSIKLSMAYIDGKQEELKYLQHLAEACDKKYAV